MQLLTLLVPLVLASTTLSVPETGRVAWKVPTRSGVTVNWHPNQCCQPCNEVTIVATMERGKIADLDLHNCACEIREPATVLTGIDPASSVDFLLAHLDDEPKEIVTAVALHEHPKVVPALIDLARHDSRREVRRNALFWLGQKAGEKAVATLRRAVDEDPDEDVRVHAVFAISQLPRERSVPLLIELAKTHKSRAVRKKAMFWLAQTGDERAIEVFEEILLR